MLAFHRTAIVLGEILTYQCAGRDIKLISAYVFLALIVAAMSTSAQKTAPTQGDGAVGCKRLSTPDFNGLKKSPPVNLSGGAQGYKGADPVNKAIYTMHEDQQTGQYIFTAVGGPKGVGANAKPSKAVVRAEFGGNKFITMLIPAQSAEGSPVTCKTLEPEVKGIKPTKVTLFDVTG